MYTKNSFSNWIKQQENTAFTLDRLIDIALNSDSIDFHRIITGLVWLTESYTEVSMIECCQTLLSKWHSSGQLNKIIQFAVEMIHYWFLQHKNKLQQQQQQQSQERQPTKPLVNKHVQKMGGGATGGGGAGGTSNEASSRRGSNSSRLFSDNVTTFKDVLQHPVYLEAFVQFCVQSWCSENIAFYRQVAEMKIKHSKGTVYTNQDLQNVMKDYLVLGASRQINIPDAIQRVVVDKINSGASDPNVLDPAFQSIFMLLKTDIYPRFRTSKLYLDARKTAQHMV